MPDVPFEWTWQGQQRHKNVRVNVPPSAAAEAPVVVLVHGTSGDFNDMADPAVHPGFNVERIVEGTIRDRGWHAYPNAGWWSIGADPAVAVDGWEPFLNGRGFPTLNYSQDAARGRLAESAAELRRLLEVLEEQRTGNTHPGFAEVAARRIVLMGQSRGGVLARQVLVDLGAAGAAVLPRVTTCITLHAPNQGSNIANVAIALDAATTPWRAAIERLPVDAATKQALFGALLGVVETIHAEAGAPAYLDYAVGSPVLAALAAAEPVPGVEYFTFGGTRPVLFNIRGWAFTADSVLPQWHDPPFHWNTAYQTLLPIPPAIQALPEVTPGAGDVLVAAAAARLPFSVHRDNYLNHAESLWDAALKIQVVAILTGGPLPDPLVVGCMIPDATDPDRTLDGLGGAAPSGGAWRLPLAEALALADRGHTLFVRRSDERLVPLQRVRRRDGRRYLRSLPGAHGPRLHDLPRCP